MSHFNPEDIATDYSEFVPFSARMMAALRAYESARDDRLFQEEFAAQLAGAEAFQRVEQLSVQDRAYVAVRTRFFDDFLRLSQAKQVVILAAGLDTRAYRLSWTEGVKLYELDYAEVLAYKAEQLRDANPNCEHCAIAADLTQAWEKKLAAAGHCSDQPSIWLAEGLLMYLTEAQVHGLLSSVSRLSALGSKFGLDLINVRSLEYEPYKGYFQSGWDAPDELLRSYGWQAKVVQPGDAAANFGRYPWSPPPSTVDAKRAFLITAVK